MLIFNLIISLFLSAAPADHGFKMSICEIIYSSEQERFEIKFYIFQDDLKAALYNNPEATQLETDAASNYILENFQLKINGKNEPLTYQSSLKKNEQLLITFTSAKHALKDISELHISNKLLIEKFRKQTNMVFLEMPSQAKKTEILNIKKTKTVFSF